MAETLIGSEIIKLAAEINEKIKNGETVYNFTIGDFNPKIFPIPAALKKEIINAYNNDETNYPAADGMPDLRKAVSNLIEKKQGLKYSADEILIAGGARPVIYAVYVTLMEPGEKVLFPVPSWNNNHYTHMSTGDYSNQVFVETSPENKFMPTAAELAPHLKDVALVAVCSPLNPTGTTFSKKDLGEICDLIIAENIRRGPGRKPLYLLYDQIYWALTYGETKHHDPVSLRPEMRDYTIYVDGISKSLAATGVRVGWAMGPKIIIDNMKSILSHVGAWAPRAEQVATAKFLNDLDAYTSFLTEMKTKINARLVAFHNGIQRLKQKGFRVDSIAPEAAIYLTIRFHLHGQKTADGKILVTTRDVTKYILDEAKIAVVPFYAFGSSPDSSWYRLSVGTCKLEEMDTIIASLEKALEKLS
ncbi:MAG: aminotransferase class I/II-fold pyridoxal phosphate-dependent enzyme [Bacteroidetes bacterium]|nr:aminotransferase class I/II-fold pyridoxal phosphate-dependent enzyme [Bacteroidota bacterium]